MIPRITGGPGPSGEKGGIQMREVGVHVFPMAEPNDLRPFEALIDRGEIDPRTVVAIITKTEGNGRVNDFSRPFAAHVLAELVGRHLGLAPKAVPNRVALVMSGGCEGVMTPHAVVFTRRPASGAATGAGLRLAVGVGFSREMTPEEVGTMVQVELTADATRAALKDAELTPGEVKFVQTKGPLLTSERINEARARGKRVVTSDVVRSLGFSNGASALGVGLGLGLISRERLRDEVICQDETLWCEVASCSAGVETMHVAVVVMGNSAQATGPYRIGHAVMQDLIDADAVRAAMGDAGLAFDGVPGSEVTGQVVAAFAKGIVDPSGRLRGYRTTLLTDSDLGTRPARAVLNAVVGSVLRTPMVYASAGWGYHQGRTGGGLVAVIAGGA